MKYYRCKCGDQQSYGSMPPPFCHACPLCGSNLATHPADHDDAAPHVYYDEMVMTNDGMKPLTLCQYCLEPKSEIEKAEQLRNLL